MDGLAHSATKGIHSYVKHSPPEYNVKISQEKCIHPHPPTSNQSKLNTMAILYSMQDPTLPHFL